MPLAGQLAPLSASLARGSATVSSALMLVTGFPLVVPCALPLNRHLAMPKNASTRNSALLISRRTDVMFGRVPVNETYVIGQGWFAVRTTTFPPLQFAALAKVLPTDEPDLFAIDALSVIVRVTSQTIWKPPPLSVNVSAVDLASLAPEGETEIDLKAAAVPAASESSSRAASAAMSSFMLLRMF